MFIINYQMPKIKKIYKWVSGVEKVIYQGGPDFTVTFEDGWVIKSAWAINKITFVVEDIDFTWDPRLNIYDTGGGSNAIAFSVGVLYWLWIDYNVPAYNRVVCSVDSDNELVIKVYLDDALVYSTTETRSIALDKTLWWSLTWNSIYHWTVKTYIE